MIHPLVKIITVDGFFTKDQASTLAGATLGLQYKETEFGREIPDFNLISPDFNEQASAVLNTRVEVDESRSGFFRMPRPTIHFEGFDGANEWVFAVALQSSTFNVYEHASGTPNALQGYQFNYCDMMQWDLKINYVLDPGQGVFFRPWLFHSFDSGLIQTFRVREL